MLPLHSQVVSGHFGRPPYVVSARHFNGHVMSTTYDYGVLHTWVVSPCREVGTCDSEGEVGWSNNVNVTESLEKCVTPLHLR